jgi:hypothetical protein
MDSVVVRCAFCGERHLADTEDLDVWHIECSCGAVGFTQEEVELPDDEFRGPGFTVQEVHDFFGIIVHMADPLPVTIGEGASLIYVSWYRKKNDSTYKTIQ